MIKMDKILNFYEFKNFNRIKLKRIATKILQECYKNSIVDEEKILNLIKNTYLKEPDLIPLINATGVVIHTNLGRSVISDELFDRIKNIISSYNNLEFDLKTGKRGSRYDALNSHLKEIFNSDVLVVNNNASAVFLILNTLSKNRSCIVSRGELVEIGGGFRIPEVMSASGAKLIEVGTTNKTRLSDYQNAINQDSAMIMKVHKSNFYQGGFTCDVDIKEIYKLAKIHQIKSYYDLGSGHIFMSKIINEPDIFLLNKFCDVLSFSGDKLLGLTQAGIILGDKNIISSLKQNQLLRMLRVDKITIATLIEGFKAYINKEFHLLKSQNQFFIDINELRKRAKFVQSAIKFKSVVSDTKSLIGGGSMPKLTQNSIALIIDGDASKNLKKFRDHHIIGRIENDKFLLDFRTIFKDDLDKLIKIINEIK